MMEEYDVTIKEKEMKHICITYHMENDKESAETCITLPMGEEVAKEVLQNGADSIKELRQLLSCLATIQGYTYCGACYAELDTKWQQLESD